MICSHLFGAFFVILKEPVRTTFFLSFWKNLPKPGFLLSSEKWVFGRFFQNDKKRRAVRSANRFLQYDKIKLISPAMTRTGANRFAEFANWKVGATSR
jgi:hypothetical protein